MSAKTQPAAISISHVIAKHGPAINMTHNMLHIQISSCAQDTTNSKIPCMKSLQSTKLPEALYTLISHYWHMPMNK